MTKRFWNIMSRKAHSRAVISLGNWPRGLSRCRRMILAAWFVTRTFGSRDCRRTSPPAELLPVLEDWSGYHDASLWRRVVFISVAASWVVLTSTAASAGNAQNVEWPVYRG